MQKLDSMITSIWCDVGGTFTDTLVEQVQADHTSVRKRLKVLSTGIVHSSVIEWINTRQLRVQLPSVANNFWASASLRFINTQGVSVFESVVQESDNQSGLLTIHDDVSSALQRSITSIDIDGKCEAPVLAARILLNVPLMQPLPSGLDIRLGTTRGTNALLTRRGSRVLFVTTAPFEDVLLIGNQERPSLFALDVHKRRPLYKSVLAVEERILSDGRIEKELDIDSIASKLQSFKEDGIESIAICLMNSYANPVHELSIAKVATDIGFEEVSVSADISPVARFVDRAETTVMDAYLSPVVSRYLCRLHQQFGGNQDTQLRVMASSGGLIDFRKYRGKDSVLSGPAGGVVVLQRLSEATSENESRKIIGLDMGGTSTDVCRLQGEPTISFEAIKADVRVLVPALDIHTVASGGGSICSFDGVEWHVGPQSAGAYPGQLVTAVAVH